MDWSNLVAPIVVLIAMVVGVRFIWRQFFGGSGRSTGSGVNLLRAFHDERRAMSGQALLESAALVSLYAAYVTLFAGVTWGPLVFLGLAVGMLLLPDLTRPLLALTTGAVALLRIDWQHGSHWLLLVVPVYFIIARLRSR